MLCSQYVALPRRALALLLCRVARIDYISILAAVRDGAMRHIVNLRSLSISCVIICKALTGKSHNSTDNKKFYPGDKFLPDFASIENVVFAVFTLYCSSSDGLDLIIKL